MWQDWSPGKSRLTGGYIHLEKVIMVTKVWPLLLECDGQNCKKQTMVYSRNEKVATIPWDWRKLDTFIYCPKCVEKMGID